MDQIRTCRSKGCGAIFYVSPEKFDNRCPLCGRSTRIIAHNFEEKMKEAAARYKEEWGDEEI